MLAGCHDPSTSPPGVPKNGTQEKAWWLRSG